MKLLLLSCSGLLVVMFHAGGTIPPIPHEANCRRSTTSCPSRTLDLSTSAPLIEIGGAADKQEVSPSLEIAYHGLRLKFFDGILTVLADSNG